MDINKIKKTFPTYFILVLLPLFFGLVLFIIALNKDNNLKIEQTKSELSERATDFMAKSTALDYFKPYFQKLAHQLFPFIEKKKNEKGIFMTNADVTNIINNYKKILGENIRCALFNEKAELINPQDLLDYEQNFFTYAWKDIHQIADAHYKERRTDQALILGKDFNIKQLYNRSEHCVLTSSLGKTSLFYFKNANENTNGIIIFVEYKSTSLDIVKAKIKDFATYEQPIILYDLEKQQRTTSTLGHKEIPFIQTESEKFLDGYLEDNIVWKGFNSDSYRLLLGKIVDFKWKYILKFSIAIIIFIVLLYLSSAFFFKNIANNEGMFISIRYKLVFLFALAIYMPTLSLWVLSYVSLHDHRTAIENDVIKGMQDVLNLIDNDYKKNVDDLLIGFRKFDKYLRSFSGKEPPTHDEVYAKLSELAPKNPNDFSYQFNWVELRHINQTQIFTTSNNESNERLEKICKVLSIICLDKYCPERLAQAGIKLSQSDIMVGNLFENPVVAFGSVFERPDTLIRLNIDGYETYWWWNYYSDINNPIGFVICDAATRYSTLEYFNDLTKRRYNYGSTNLKVIFYHSIDSLFFPNNSGNNELVDLMNVSNINKTVETANITYENKKYLCLCMPGSHLKDCFVFSMYPISEIDYQIEKLRSTIYTVMILVLITSVLTGLLLAKNFILPVNELNKGLAVLRKRETDTIIKIENKDELGLLGQAFNQMMIDIKDLLLASAVQQCLIPSGKYKIEGYDCLVYNQMAANLGGDYADIIELPDKKALIVIGDVTGHGISASLLTAMVKASVFRFANKQDVPLNEILSKTSLMIYDILKKKRLMTFCAVILDEKTGELSVCNAGHPSPILKEKEKGKYRITQLSGFPMGASKRRCNYTIESEHLNPEETLFLFTDGFPEAENEKGELYGYENFNKLIGDTLITSANEFKDYLLKVFKKHHGEAELADDLTFIILRRKPLQNS